MKKSAPGGWARRRRNGAAADEVVKRRVRDCGWEYLRERGFMSKFADMSRNSTAAGMSAKSYLGWLWRMSRGCRRDVAWIVAVGIGQVCAALGFVWLSKHLVDIATGASEGSIWVWAAWLGALVAGRIALGAAGSRLQVRATARMGAGLRERCFEGVIWARGIGGERHSGDVMERMRKDVDQVTDVATATVPQMAVTALQLAGATAFMAVLDWRLAVAVVMIMPVALVIGKSFFRRMRRFSRDIRSRESDIHEYVQEHVRHRILDATYDGREAAVERLQRKQEELVATVMRRNRTGLVGQTMVSAGFAAGYATAFLWGVWGLSTGTVTFGVMTAFLQLVAQIQRPAVSLGRMVPALVYGHTAAERVAELTGAESEERGEEIRLGRPTGVRVRDVWFGYEGDAVLRGVTHVFEPGSVTAVTGATGAGKSTLMRLILGLLKPQEGEVNLFDREGREAKASARTRGNIVYVPQGNSLVAGTIRENLLMGRRDATDGEMMAALHDAGADFVKELSEGLDARCGEGGAGLSEGQAQRVAIARGLLRGGGVMLVDEPTAALDPATAERVTRTLTGLGGRLTVIIITHREDTARMCGSVLRID